MYVTIAQVEDFWSLYNHVSLASNLPPGSDYSFFKVGEQLICVLGVWLMTMYLELEIQYLPQIGPGGYFPRLGG